MIFENTSRDVLLYVKKLKYSKLFVSFELLSDLSLFSPILSCFSLPCQLNLLLSDLQIPPNLIPDCPSPCLSSQPFKGPAAFIFYFSENGEGIDKEATDIFPHFFSKRQSEATETNRIYSLKFHRWEMLVLVLLKKPLCAVTRGISAHILCLVAPHLCFCPVGCPS